MDVIFGSHIKIDLYLDEGKTSALLSNKEQPAWVVDREFDVDL